MRVLSLRYYQMDTHLIFCVSNITNQCEQNIKDKANSSFLCSKIFWPSAKKKTQPRTLSIPGLLISLQFTHTQILIFFIYFNIFTKNQKSTPHNIRKIYILKIIIQYQIIIMK